MENLTGQKFGKLLVIEYIGKDKKYQPIYKCKCDCGNMKNANGYRLKNGYTQSCGCDTVEKIRKHTTKHGKYYTRLYRIWNLIRNRCKNPSCQTYKYYGGRGIKVCCEWDNLENGFINFYNWAMTNGYADNLTIDRIDTDGNYEPTNCRWATIEEQANNKRNNIVFEIDGEKLTLKQIANKYNLYYKTLFTRISRGWDIKTAIERPIGKNGRKGAKREKE